jgi:hypothetical protein
LWAAGTYWEIFCTKRAENGLLILNHNLHFSVQYALHRQLENNFCKGVIEFKHMYQKLEEHKKSKIHSAAVELFVVQCKKL